MTREMTHFPLTSTRMRLSRMTFFALWRNRPDRADMLDEPLLAQREHLPRGVGNGEQRAWPCSPPCRSPGCSARSRPARYRRSHARVPLSAQGARPGTSGSIRGSCDSRVEMPSDAVSAQRPRFGKRFAFALKLPSQTLLSHVAVSVTAIDRNKVTGLHRIFVYLQGAERGA